MTGQLLPRPLSASGIGPIEPQEVVEAFLAALAEPDLATADSLLDEHVLYVNVGLPAVRGRRRTMKLLGALDGRCSFEVYLHAIASDGATVLTERTDVLVFGPLRLQFWVTGRFDVRDGQITLWRDSFDQLDIARALVRGLAGSLVPALRPSAPTSPATPPGRH